jgi:hypothetical protein
MPTSELPTMSSLPTLYLSIAVAVCAVVAVVALHSAAADVVSGLIVIGALGVVARTVMRLAGDDDETARRPRTTSSPAPPRTCHRQEAR